MDDFVARCKAAGPPKTKEEAYRRKKEYLKIQRRINRHALDIIERVSAGDPAPPPKRPQV
jgi:hypothetical protein